MKKTLVFERLTEEKFRTTELSELKNVTGGLAVDLIMDTITVTDSGSHNDGQQYPIDKGLDEGK
jgi:hypothetical protein